MSVCAWHRRLSLSIAVLMFTLAVPSPAHTEALDCGGYDSHVWAQSVFETDPIPYAALHPDGNGRACEELPVDAAPAW